MKSDTDSNFPEMKMVVASYGEKIVMEPTLDGAIEKLFGTGGQKPRDPDIEYGDAGINDLINKANLVFHEATSASQTGNWAEYGRKINELEKILNQLSIMIRGDQEEGQDELIDAE